MQFALSHVPGFAGSNEGWGFLILLLFNRPIIMYIKGQIIRFLINLIDRTVLVKSYTIAVIQPSLLML
jgi:hypothetical protein